MSIKRLIYLSIIFGGLLLLVTACHTDYLQINYKPYNGFYSSENETELAFLLNTSAYRKAQGVSQFPDGGIPKYLHRSIGLFYFNTNSKQLTKLVSFDDLIYRNFNIPNSIKMKIAIADSCIFYQITPITAWDIYLKWCKSSTDSTCINILNEKYQKQYKVRIGDKQIAVVDSMAFNAAFKNQ